MYGVSCLNLHIEGLGHDIPRQEVQGYKRTTVSYGKQRVNIDFGCIEEGNVASLEQSGTWK